MTYATIKHFDKHINKLKHLCGGLGLQLISKDWVDSSAYDYHFRTIKIDAELEDVEYLSTFLHELGHAVAELSTSKHKCKIQWKAYTKYYKNKHTKRQYFIVRQCEIEAWNVGANIAKMLKIPLGKWFYTERRLNLASYTYR
jgi:hypothetical protein